LKQGDKENNYEENFLETLGDNDEDWLNIQRTFGYMPSILSCSFDADVMARVFKGEGTQTRAPSREMRIPTAGQIRKVAAYMTSARDAIKKNMDDDKPIESPFDDPDAFQK
jgi:hypothetical protein